MSWIVKTLLILLGVAAVLLSGWLIVRAVLPFIFFVLGTIWPG